MKIRMLAKKDAKKFKESKINAMAAAARARLNTGKFQTLTFDVK